MQDSDKIQTLKQLAACEVSIAEAALSIKELKRLQPVQDAFLTGVEVESWEEARQKFPQHATVKGLKQFVGMDAKNPPNEFLVCII